MTTIAEAIDGAEDFTSMVPNGATTLDDLHAALIQFVVLASAEAADAVVLWIAATHAQQSFEHATRLVIKSPQKRSGKTRLLEIIEDTANRPRRTSNISPAALIRLIDEADPPAFLIDEADAIFKQRRGETSETAETLRGLINAGHSRGAAYTRYDMKRREVEECSAFAMAAIAAIGDLPDTIEDRAVIIQMRRRAPSEKVTPYRRKHARPLLHAVREQLAAWVSLQRAALADAEPRLPVEDRAADVWEPLVAIADAAGGDWPMRARRACELLTGHSGAEEGNESERLLEDLFGVFAHASALTTTAILDALKEIDDAPWSDWASGRGLSSRGLAQLLRPYGIKSKNLREGDKVPKGYERDQFADAWTRYARPDATGATSATEAADELESRFAQGPGDVADLRAPSATHPLHGEDQAQQRLERPVADAADVADTSVEDAAHCDNGCGRAVEEPGWLCDVCADEAVEVVR